VHVEEVAVQRRLLTRLMLLSVAAGLATIALKMLAWQLTGSTGLLSDALESIVNLAAALIALAVVRWATLPADAEHMYGHEKAEYFSAGVEGGLIMVAAASIAWVAIRRLLHPVPLEDVSVGLALSAAASLINLLVGLTLVRAGRRHRSITVEADGRHLLTDVWTSAGVIAGVTVVALTGWERLDPLIALAVAANIVFTGINLVRRSSGGLMDHALSPGDQQALDGALATYRSRGITFHAIRNRQAGRRSFVSMHVLVPGDWTIQQGHELLERIETDVRTALPHTTVFTHIEPVEDPSSFYDTALDRDEASPTGWSGAARTAEPSDLEKPIRTKGSS
jgi:cation diffusion facilitator family transporter